MTWLVILASWIVPMLIYFWLGWRKLPKNSTLGDLGKLLNREDPEYLPPIQFVLIPGINLMCLLVTITLLADKLFHDCKIRIK